MYHKKPVFFGACLGLLLFGIGLITLGSVAPDLKVKFGLDEISAGALFSILPLGILTGSLVFGPFCDKYGYQLLLILSCMLICAGFVGIAYATSRSWLQVSIYVFGIAGGCLNGATNAVVADISSSNKGANLSILGVFFGIGALGMPAVTGLLRHRFSFETILAANGIIALAIAVFFACIRFPAPKQSQGFPLLRSLSLVKDKVIILIAFFLFCQSSFEALLNNWTTSYLMERLEIPQSEALYALSVFVAGMTVMRLLTGSVLRRLNEKQLLVLSFILIALGLLLLGAGQAFTGSLAALALLGAGLAGGFPIMLGIVGERYKELSGTAFSFVLVIALTGNMLVNYCMGLIAQRYGIRYLPLVALAELGVMVLLSARILQQINKKNLTNKNSNYVSKTMA